MTCVWLLPFYPSPDRDNGYDISDYYGVDPRLGNLGDVVEFVRQADELGIRVIIDLVVNHTSDQHPWFQAARADRDSRYRDYYVWSDEPPERPDAAVAFPGQQTSNWTHDDQSDSWYYHVFYASEPDLNTANAQVVEEIYKIMGFWLALGVSGFRVDAAPFLVEKTVVLKDNVQNPHDFFRDLRYFLTTRRGDAILLAEANVTPDHLSLYFGDGNEMNLLYDFVLNNQVMLALARRKAAPIAKGISLLPDIPPMCQWATFLHTYDELDLSRLTHDEREEVYAAFAPDQDMRIFGRGIRRRIPPMLNGDHRWLYLAYSLLFTLPGTPVLIYGEEIGMGDDLSQRGRFAVRSPMQWTDDANGGFSTAPADQLVRPIIDHGDFDYRKVNVERERPDQDSVLSRTSEMIRRRKESPEFGWGEVQVLDTGDDAVFTHLCEWKGRTVLAVHNLSDDDRVVQLDLGDRDVARLQETVCDQHYDKPEGRPLRVELSGFGYRWFRLGDVSLQAI